jgi:hypothetical protein
MKKYFVALIISIMSTVVAADSKLKYIDENCINAYLRVDELLQFLYKFDGNLPTIKETKIKNLEFLISQFRGFKNSEGTRRQAFSELFNDPDYYQFLVQEKSSNLIKEIEEFKLKSSPTKDKNLINALPKASTVGDYDNPYLKLQKLVKIQNNVRSFFEELESTKTRFEALKEDHRFSKSLDNDSRRLGFIIAMNKSSMIQVIECNLELLEAKRVFK